MTQRLNCDLGESFGPWTLGMDSQVMPYIDEANIACGFHAGDPVVIKNTLLLAKRHNVAVGAHPSYPDLAGFGRRSMTMPATELIASLNYQIAALVGMAANEDLELKHVKPHGALYNDMMKNGQVRSAVMQAIAESHHPLTLVLQATPNANLHRQEASAFGLSIVLEAFIDRCYNDDGTLVSRTQSGAIHNREKMLQQVSQLVQQKSVTTQTGKQLSVEADTLCLHGDNPIAVAEIQHIRHLVR